VAPSILSADFAKFGEEVEKIDKAGADIIHVDVMDAHFVPNLTFGPPVIKAIRKYTSLIFDVHLMISDPLKYAKAFADAGADHITFHVEAENDPLKVIEEIRKCGCTAGISMKPKTPAEAIFPYLDKLDLVLVMSVEPGFGGQSFMLDMMPKVTAIRKEIEKRSLNIHLEIDGGIDKQTVHTAAAAGANMMVAGTAVFKYPTGYADGIKILHDAQSSLKY
jgi:ribulose-phosphate 3-epimerase